MARRGLPEINAGSMADIAFLLLIFFLVTTTMDQDSGISRKLPPMPEPDQEAPPQLNARNIFRVTVTWQSEDEVFYKFGDPKRGGKQGRMKISELKEAAKDFITNGDKKNPKPFLAENSEKAIISLQTDENVKYVTYIRVQNELTAAYNEVRNETAMKDYGRAFELLDREKKKLIRKVYPQKISEAEPKESQGLKN